LTQNQAAARKFIPASVVLQELDDAAPADQFTLGWLMGRLQKQSFGLIMLLLAIVAVAPGISVLGGWIIVDSGVPDDCRSLCSRLPALDCDRSLPTKRRRAARHVGAEVS
jgi:hypothetical protein